MSLSLRNCSMALTLSNVDIKSENLQNSYFDIKSEDVSSEECNNSPNGHDDLEDNATSQVIAGNYLLFYSKLS